MWEYHPAKAEQGLEGGFATGFPPLHCVASAVESEALEALLPAASGEQGGSLPSESVCSFLYTVAT